MIDWLKTNWKTALVAGIVAICILCLCCCEGKSAEEALPTDAEVEALDIKIEANEEKLQELLEEVPVIEEVVPKEVVPEEVVE